MKTDVLIIGAGGAGLLTAIRLAEIAPHLKVCIAHKSRFEASNTYLAQGGVACVCDDLLDSMESHIADTMNAGQWQNDSEVVHTLVEQIPAKIQEVQGWGLAFDKEESGDLALGLEGGHSAHRIVHVKDHTGRALMDTLLQRARTLPNIQFMEEVLAFKLLPGSNGTAHACIFIDLCTGAEIHLQANCVVLATGGSGRLFSTTSNSSSATGDGLYLAQTAGISMSHLNYYQFHPTVLKGTGTLISEAVRGEGAKVVDDSGREFLYDYDPRGGLATRDVVCRAIYKELQSGNTKGVWLDARHLSGRVLKAHFPDIYKTWEGAGLNPQNDLIPIEPAAHYQCGGISTTQDGQTSVPGIFALGECANNGLHGANRLASNSLAELLVFSDRLATSISQYWAENSVVEVHHFMPNLSLWDLRETDNYKSISIKLKQHLTDLFNQPGSPVLPLDLLAIWDRLENQILEKKARSIAYITLFMQYTVSRLFVEHRLGYLHQRVWKTTPHLSTFLYV
jgi:L-aspartate oxidase